MQRVKPQWGTQRKDVPLSPRVVISVAFAAIVLISGGVLVSCQSQSRGVSKSSAVGISGFANPSYNTTYTGAFSCKIDSQNRFTMAAPLTIQGEAWQIKAGTGFGLSVSQTGPSLTLATNQPLTMDSITVDVGTIDDRILYDSDHGLSDGTRGFVHLNADRGSGSFDNVPLAEAEVEPLQVLMVNGPFVCV